MLVEILDAVVLYDVRLRVILCSTSVLAASNRADPWFFIRVKTNVTDEVAHARGLLIAVWAFEICLVVIPQVAIETLCLSPNA